jgi:hypothetical protein
MGDWKPDKTVEIEGTKIHFWVIPDKGVPKNLSARSANFESRR